MEWAKGVSWLLLLIPICCFFCLDEVHVGNVESRITAFLYKWKWITSMEKRIHNEFHRVYGKGRTY